MPSPTAFLIDGTAFCYRAFYAIRGLATSDGRPTNAVYGFATMLQSLCDKQRPDYLAVAFDVGKPTFRHRKFDAYKQQRKPMPDLLISQLPLVKRLLVAFRIPVFEQEGYEAEDVLASVAVRLAQEGVEVFLVTGDKDALQLVTDRIKVYNPHKDEGVVFDAQAVRKRYGVGPEGMVDLMALMGDQIDNIPGVDGIGEKTAVQLLQRFGTLEQLYTRLDDVGSPSRKQALAASREQVALARELARVHTDVPVAVRLDELKIHEPDWRGLKTLFRELEFKRLLAGLEARGSSSPGFTVRAHLVDGSQDLAQAIARWSKAEAVGVVTTSLRASDAGAPSAPLLSVAVAVSKTDAWVMPAIDAAWLASADGARFAAWLANPNAPKLCHDAKTAMRLWQRLGLTFQGIAGDTMLAAYVLNPARSSPTLSDLVDDVLEISLTQPVATNDQWAFDASMSESLSQAACAILQLHERLAEDLRRQGLERVYRELELPLSAVLAEMEEAGVALDVAYLDGLRHAMQAKLATLSEALYERAGGTFNLNSPKQLAEVLFTRLKLPIIKRTKTGPSTDNHVLQQLAKHHPLPQSLIEYRELSKLVSTYVEALPKLIDPRTGRLHTSFNQAATTTGRLSSSEPNLQNIPIKTELGRSIRKAFVAGLPHSVLVAADYSQIELRILAHLCQDERLCEAFRQDHDIHRFTASLIYGIPESEVQPEQRSAMKAVNFGILYGMTSHGLSKELGLSYEEAQAFIDAYFARYPKVRVYLDAQIEHAKRNGFVETLFGRRRYIPEVRSPDAVLRQVGERMAVNAPIQGTAADLIKRAMIELATQLRARGMTSRMILQVHDELVCESVASEQADLVGVMRQVMEGVAALSVPLKVTVKAGSNWLEMVALL